MLKQGVYCQLAPVLFGSGSRQETGAKAKELGMHKVLVVTDPSIVKLGHEKKILASLAEANIEYVLWPEAIGDCPDTAVRAAAKVAVDNKVDGIVGLGGGSSLDTAKAAAVVAANGEEILEEIPAYLSGQKKYQHQPLKKLLIPTTFGTGSEVTFVCVINDSKLDCKIGLPSSPDYAIVDPELSLGMPAFITAFTGLDAFSHAHESLTEKKSTEHSDLLAYEAMRLVAKWLPVACEDINNLQAREYLALASNYAGIPFSESGTHVAHSIAQAIGHKFHVAHGVACALSLPPAIEFIALQYPEKIKKIGEAIDIEVSSNDPAEIGKIIADWVRGFMKKLGIKSYKEQGLTLEDCLSVEDMVYADDLFHCFDGEVSREDLRQMLKDMYETYQ